MIVSSPSFHNPKLHIQTEKIELLLEVPMVASTSIRVIILAMHPSATVISAVHVAVPISATRIQPLTVVALRAISAVVHVLVIRAGGGIVRGGAVSIIVGRRPVGVIVVGRAIASAVPCRAVASGIVVCDAIAIAGCVVVGDTVARSAAVACGAIVICCAVVGCVVGVAGCAVSGVVGIVRHLVCFVCFVELSIRRYFCLPA